MLLYIFLLFSVFAQTAVVEVCVCVGGVGGYKFAESNNPFILGSGPSRPQKLLGK